MDAFHDSRGIYAREISFSRYHCTLNTNGDPQRETHDAGTLPRLPGSLRCGVKSEL